MAETGEGMSAEEKVLDGNFQNSWYRICGPGLWHLGVDGTKAACGFQPKKAPRGYTFSAEMPKDLGRVCWRCRYSMAEENRNKFTASGGFPNGQ